MHIWILNHYAGGADRQTTGHYDIGRQLVAKGHRVTIFASSFSHYKFQEERLQRGEKWRSENHEGVEFVWLRTVAYHGNDWRRALNMLSYACRVLWMGLRRPEKPDIIIGTCPHPFAVLAAYLLALRKATLFFFEVRDLWPQTLIDVGALSEKNPLAWALRMLEKFLYAKAVRIISVLPNVGEYLAAIGILKAKLVWIPNGADLARYDGVQPYNGGLEKPFTVVYLGGHARYNGVEVIIRAAERLQKRNRNDIRLVLVGDGPQKALLIRQAQECGLRNVEFRPLVPKAEIGKVMNEASACLHHIRDLPLLKYGMSSNKLFDYMAAGRPVIFACNSSNNPVKEAGAGLSVPAENPEALAQAILELAALSPEQRMQLGRNGRAYVERHHNIKILAERLESVCLSALAEKSAAPKSPGYGREGTTDSNH